MVVASAKGNLNPVSARLMLLDQKDEQIGFDTFVFSDSDESAIDVNQD